MEIEMERKKDYILELNRVIYEKRRKKNKSL